ncbi:MAG: NAD(P)H-hydrate dehydratase [Dehalococcoidia bacterium]|nr:NAD(P)H-hydrate dehydratase [Dehalococcoidia bacterium]
MAKLVTTEQMRALEQTAVEAGVSERSLMAQAGLAVAQEAWMTLGTVEDKPVLVLCGPGNNGGDGLVAARQLAEWGAPVHVYLLRPRPEDDPEWAAVREADLPVTVAEADPTSEALEGLLRQAVLVIDALFGTGLRPAERPLEGAAAAVLARLRAAREATPAVQLLAADLPSGVDADTGVADPATVAADLTVTFGCAKLGLFQAPGRTLAGRVEVVDIGIPAAAVRDLPFEDLRMRDLRAAVPPRAEDGNKGTFGRALIVAGSRRYPGAARLAAEAAARSGCGVVTIAAPEAVQPLLVALPDPTHEPLPTEAPGGGELDAASARALLRALRGMRARALLVGPGLGLSDATRGFVQHLLAGLDAAAAEGGTQTVVLDADALNVIAGEADWHARFALPRILTPHPGEMARLLRTSVEDVQAHRLPMATEYAQRTGSVVVLKGAGTIVAAPDGRARLSDVAHSALAHGGTGDVLAGLIVGLLAQGVSPFDAASAAVWLQAECARQVSEVYGPASTLASDLLRALPEARKLLDPPSAGPAGPDVMFAR